MNQTQFVKIYLDETSNSCCVCCGRYSSSNNHKMCYIRCGHVFGKSCIEAWFQRVESGGKCPQCQQVSNMEDIQDLNVRKVVSLNNQMHSQLEEEKRLKLYYQTQFNQLRINSREEEVRNLNIRIQSHDRELIRLRRLLNMERNNSALKSKEENEMARLRRNLEEANNGLYLTLLYTSVFSLCYLAVGPSLLKNLF